MAAKERHSDGAIFNRAVRSQKRWQVAGFLLDFQDSYHPQVVLRQEDLGYVLYGSEKQGFSMRGNKPTDANQMAD